MSKAYLGDSVYVEIDTNVMLKLTTENGYGATQTIYLEPEVYENLRRYVEAHPLFPQRAAESVSERT